MSEKVRFQICGKLPAFFGDRPIGDQIIELDEDELRPSLGPEHQLLHVQEMARRLVFGNAEIYVEELEPYEKLEPNRFTSKNKSDKPITSLKVP